MGPELGVTHFAMVHGLLPGFQPPDGGGISPLLPSTFDATFAAASVIIGIGFVVVIVLAIRSASVYLKRGIDPTTVDAQMKARLLQSTLLDGGGPASSGAGWDAPAPRSVEDRLAVIDRLVASGAISEAERETARAEVLRDL